MKLYFFSIPIGEEDLVDLVICASSLEKAQEEINGLAVELNSSLGSVKPDVVFDLHPDKEYEQRIVSFIVH